MRFDALVCDFIMPAINCPDIRDCVIFQHNVETMIWRRHAETAPDPVRRAYFQNQAEKMFKFERAMCRAARHVIGVSAADAALMQSMFGIEEISHVSTGVDVEYFAPKPVEPQADLVFVGSMDWLPNIDGVTYFTETVLPVIRRWRPDCSFAVVGRNPPAKIKALAKRDPNIRVTGTVPDVRPYLWGSKVSIVPLRIGGGTRLKIYESMAARVPVVSTTIGAEGLDVHPPHDISIADTPESFASACVALLNSEEQRQNMASEAWNMVTSQFSWAKIALHFEEIIECRGRLSPA
jgi:glycosyltransferase involved in cell wall biosynthesis